MESLRLLVVSTTFQTREGRSLQWVDSPEIQGLGFLEDLVVFPKLGRLIFLVVSGLLWHQETNSFEHLERKAQSL